MSYKSLNLERDKIESAIKNFSEKALVQIHSKPHNLYIYTVKAESESLATLNVYYLNDGTTTILAETGKNHSLSKKIADYVVEKCEVKNIPEKSLYIKKLSEDDFTTLLEFLQDFNAKVEEGKNLPHGKQYKIISPYGDYVLLNKYDAGSFQVQGRGKIIKSWVIEGLTGLLPYKEIIDAQLKELDVNVSPETVISGLENVIPTAFEFLGNKLQAIMSPAIALNSVNITLSDYSAFVFPALKGLEGYIKKLLSENNVIVGNDGFGSILVGGSTDRLNSTTIATINNTKIVRAIEECYTYYKKQRHGLFHVDGIVETSRVISKREEANEIITEIFDIIQKTYSNIVTI